MLSVLVTHIAETIKEKLFSSPLEHVLLPPHLELGAEKHFKVAVIGGGMSGASAAYWLRLMGVSSVTVYEASEQLGGRVRLGDFDGKFFEIGASILHDSNVLAVNFARLFNLEIKRLAHSRFARTEIRSQSPGAGVVRKIFASTGFPVIDFLKLVLRYGLLTLISFYVSVQLLLWQFARVYGLLQAGVSFSRPQDLIAAVFQQVSSSFLRSPRKPTLFDAEIAAAGLNCNYGQTILPEFTAAVSAAGMQSGNLFSIKGGNFLLASHILKSSGARIVLNTRVTAIARTETGKFSVLLENNIKEHFFDAVVFAAPIETSAVTLNNEAISAHIPRNLVYRKTVVTFVRGTLREKQISALLWSDPDSNIRSIGLQVAVDADQIEGERIAKNCLAGKVSVWKIFSTEIPTDEELDKYFESVESKKVAASWDAYPNYENNELYPFVLTPGVFTTSAFERTASAIETALIAGKNVALLVREHLLLIK